MKNNNKSILDYNQVVMHMFDQEYDAQRVNIVNGGAQLAESIKDSLKDMKFEVDQDKVIEAIKTIKLEQPAPQIQYIVQKEYEKIEIPTIVKEFDIKEIQVPVIVTETKTIEIPVIVPEVRIVEIEKPIIVTEIKIVEVEKQVVVKEYKEPNMDILKLLLAIQTVSLIISLFLRK